MLNNTQQAKARHWAKMISFTGGAQIVVQIAGLITGFVLVRLMSVEEYALYTIANTMLATMTVLADAGIATGVMAQGGKVWEDNHKLSQVLTTGISLRKYFAVLSILVCSPILYYLLDKQGAEWYVSLLIVLALIPAFLATLSDSLLELVPKLHQDIKPLQKNQLGVAVGRFILSISAVFLFPFTAVAMLGNGIPRIFGNLRLRKIASKYVNLDAEENKEYRKSILSVVKRRLPEAIYYSFSAQVAMWFLSFFGNTTNIAQLGAISKVALLTSFFSVLFGMLITPRFARLPASRGVLIKKYIHAMLFSVVGFGLMILGIWLFSDFILEIMGEEYEGLNYELLLFFISTCITLTANYNFGLFSARGWIMHPLFSILLNVAALLVCAYFVDVSTLQGAIMFSLLSSCIHLAINTLYLIFSIIRNTK